MDFVAFIDLDQSSMLNGFFLIVLDFQSALDFLVFQGLDAWFLRFVVSVVFRGLDSVFVWILDFLVSLRTVFQLDFGFLDLGFGFWFF